MKKTNFTQIHSLWYLSKNFLKGILPLLVLFLWTIPQEVDAQQPNCAQFSPAINQNGYAVVGPDDFVSNPNAVDYPLTVHILNQWGGLAFPEFILNADDTYMLNVCNYLGKTLQFSVSTTSLEGAKYTCNLGQMILNGTPGVVLTSGLGTTVTGPNVGYGKINVYCGTNVPTTGPYIPTAVSPCGGRATAPVLQPDWVMPYPCNIESDTAKVVYRTWESYDKEGRLATWTDTIVYFRLPLLTPAAFVNPAEEEYYCELAPVYDEGESLKRYASWKQPMGLHDYERPHAKLRGLTYEIPATIIIAGLVNAYAQGQTVFEEYLECVIVKKANGTSITIGDIVSGDYLATLFATTTPEQKLYGFLQVLIELNENPVTVVLGALLEFFPYVLLELGDWALSEDGNYEQVTSDWFFNGHGNSPFWFAGGWPSIYGSGDCVSYCDTGADEDFDCIRIQVPQLTLEGITGQCTIICLPEGVHCGITIKKDAIADWTGTCPQTRGVDSWITQTCWATTINSCAQDATVGCGNIIPPQDNVVVDYSCSDKAVKIHLSQWQTLIDNIPPIFDFCYPYRDPIFGGEVPNGNVQALYYDEECISPYAYWDHEAIRIAIQNGEQYWLAEDWEYCNPTVYRVGSHECAATIYVPDVKVIDNCSGVHSVKASVEVQGGIRMVKLDQTNVETKIMDNGEICYVYTYSHITNPIKVPFNGCDGDMVEVHYEAADNCWNQSQWTKYIQIVDDVPPTVVTDRAVNVPLNSKTEWVYAETFDEGSWDNCAIDLMLVRRSDWWADEACIDLCGDVTNPYDNWHDLLVDIGFSPAVVSAGLSGSYYGINGNGYGFDFNKLKKFLNDGEVEQYYFNQIIWLAEDEEQCGEKVVAAWIFAIASYLAEHCSVPDEHQNRLDIRDLENFFDNISRTPGYGQELSLLGGGWAKALPVKCHDACQEVTAELLVMDYCCNWATGWSDVYVEDKSNVRVVKHLEDLEISCEAYNVFYKDIVEAAAALGENGSENDDSGAFDALDEAFGTYIKTWVDNQNRPTDINGVLLPEESLNFEYQNITCYEESEEEKIAVYNHDGTIGWITKIHKTTYLDTADYQAMHGIIAINCTATCVQDVWVDLDECGQGTITRRFFISSGCGDYGQPRVVEQVIRVESACGMRGSMFDLPENVGTKDEPVCLPQGLSQAYFPAAALGDLTVKPHLVGKLCNAFATGKDIKEYSVQGTDLTKYVVEWSVIDWCAPHTSTNREYKYTQEIIAVIDAGCEIEGPVDTTGQDTTDVSLIAGTIQTEYGEAVQQVEMKAVLGSGSPLTTQTSGEGTYNFSISNGSQVSLVPAKNTGHANGVSTMDLIDIQRHVLQKQTLDSKYKRIAADVNGSGNIDALDVLELRKLIMKPDSKFANNTSWRFFDTQTDKEAFDLSNVNGDVTVDWIGVKIGDVNLDGDPARSSRSVTGELNLNVADKTLKAGELYRVDVTSDNFVNINGMQYTLSYLPNLIEVESIEAGALNVTKDNYLHYAPGTITSSWSEADAQSVSGDAVLFTLVVKAKSEVQLRDVFSLNNRVTRTEAYDAEGGLKNVSLRFDGQETGFALYQNTPNPYAGETVIGFKLPEASKATLSVYDVTGKVLKIVEGEYNQGYNEVKLKSSDLNATGVLYYQLDTKTYTATKKMIVIE